MAAAKRALRTPGGQLLHHPEGEIDIDALEFHQLAAGLAQVEVLKDRFAVIKASIEIRGCYRGESPRVGSGEER
jgi:hypothetical protein